MADLNTAGDMKRDDSIEKSHVNPVEQVDLNRNIEARYVYCDSLAADQQVRPRTNTILFYTEFATPSKASPVPS